MNLNQVTISVDNFDASFEFYKNLGLIPIVKSEHYARFVCENKTTFSIHKKDEDFSGTVIYFESDSSEDFNSSMSLKTSNGCGERFI